MNVIKFISNIHEKELFGLKADTQILYYLFSYV